jgi:hypothetical protein
MGYWNISNVEDKSMFKIGKAQLLSVILTVGMLGGGAS